MAKSYFAILGIASTASAGEIRAAYHRRVKEFHRDRFTGNNEPLQQILEAYSVVGHASKRHAYEETLRKASLKRPAGHGPDPDPPVPRQQHTADMGAISPMRSFETFSPSRDEIFDWLWTNFLSLEWPKSGRIQDLTIEIPLTREQAMQGGNARVMIPARAGCPACKGHGAVGVYECTRCAGEGAISGEVPVSISFPPGLGQDHAVILSLERFGIRNLRLTVWFRLTDG